MEKTGIALWIAVATRLHSDSLPPNPPTRLMVATSVAPAASNIRSPGPWQTSTRTTRSDSAIRASTFTGSPVTVATVTRSSEVTSWLVILPSGRKDVATRSPRASTMS